MMKLITMVTNTTMLGKAGGNLASGVFELKDIPDDLARPIVLTLKFDPSKIGEGQQAAIHYFNETNQIWEELGGQVMGSLITVQVNQMGKFAVLAVENQIGPSDHSSIVDITRHLRFQLIQ
ncbi:hypothetical protein RE628_01810 [Paenibacillus sp. D2_2]|uniref:hypothetical protein n=1 Tax=Paenibacillus sp. D2_2 TaxID=3073092 RepID=UPI002814AF37|nr:hypothetical protein [Paenibacillus sp. D2_2]WMT41342.1 hypothetical protein RE628_01810 [Paenibacillus sp. D2_2]